MKIWDPQIVLKFKNMETIELTNIKMHKMIHNVLQHSNDSKLTRNIIEALEDGNYRSIFLTYETEIINFNKQYINIKNTKTWKKKQEHDPEYLNF
jgi:hypothetical protein